MPQDKKLLKLQEEAKARHKNRAPDLMLPDPSFVFIKNEDQAKKEPQVIEEPVKIMASKKVYKQKVIKRYFDIGRKEITQSKIDQSVRSDEFKQRPPAIYDNIPSPYGIASELLMEQLKKIG
jgi:hypothetical protein